MGNRQKVRNFDGTKDKEMNTGKVRTAHRRIGISIVGFLFVQVGAGMLMSAGRLSSVEMSPPYNILYYIHADWGLVGDIYRFILGIATATQGVLGIIIFRGLCHLGKRNEASARLPSLTRRFRYLPRVLLLIFNRYFGSRTQNP